jgi:hypothetical protein
MMEIRKGLSHASFFTEALNNEEKTGADEHRISGSRSNHNGFAKTRKIS